jgi:hypothetical protein
MNDSGALNVPLVNNVLSRFTSQYTNTNITNVVAKPKEDALIKEFSHELRDREDLTRNFENLSKELILMGFHPKNVLHSFLVYKYKTTEEGIELLSKNSDGLSNHRFIESDEEKCFICQEYENDHRDLKRISINKKQSVNIPTMSIENILEKKKTFEIKKEYDSLKINLNNCKICFLEINEKENVFNLDCKHIFCKECIMEYLKEEIKNARVMKIKCPEKGCEEPFDDNVIKSHTDDEHFYKYKKFLQRAKIKDDPNLTECPIVDCEGFANKNEGNLENDAVLEINNGFNSEIVHNSSDEELKKKLITRKRLICNKGHSFCSHCNRAWHGEETCDADKEIKDFATFSGFIVKKCPQCKVWTEKSDGCNHMTCKICSFNWCWLCENECPQDHYLIEGTPCYGRQFNEPANPEELEMARMMQTNVFVSNFLMVYLLSFLIISATLTAAYRNNNQNNVNRQRPSKIVMYLTLSCIFLLALVFMIIFNGYIGLTMLFNLRHLNGINNCAKLTIVLTFIVLYLVFFIIGGPILTLIWFVTSNIYLIIKLILV